GHVASAAPIDNAASASSFEDDSHSVCIGLNVKVRAASYWTQVRGCRRTTQSAPRRQLVIAGAFLRRAVEIAIGRNAKLRGGTDEGVDQRMSGFDVGDPQGAVIAVIGVGAARVVLELAKIRQHFVVAPTRIAERCPMVVVLTLSPNVNEAVDR